MAIVYESINKNRLEVEEFIAQETQKRIARETKEAKKRPILLSIYVILIVATIAAVLFVLFWPGMLSNILDVVKTQLFDWGDQIAFTYDDLENGDYSGDFGERLTSGIGELLMICLRWLGSSLLYLLAFLSPVLVVGGMILLAFWIVRLCCTGISWIGWRGATPAELESYVIRTLPDKMAGLYAGVQGELRALEAVSSLGDDCYVFANLVVWLDDHKNETDLIVVSPTGLTIIEVKNYTGTFLGDLSDPEIIQRKYRRNGKYTEEKRSNPVHQIEAPANKLEEFLKRKGITTKVRRCALFISDDITLQLTDRQRLINTCPLFIRESPELLRYLNSETNRSLPDEEIQKIVSVLRKLV